MVNLKNYFEPSRFWLLLKMELYKGRKGVLITLDIAIGLLFFMSLILEPIVENIIIYDSHEGNYASVLLIGGFILSSLAFSDLGSSLKRFSYLTLPVSTFERFLCMWLLTSVGWVVLFSSIYAVYTIVANQVGGLLFGHVTFLPFDPFGDFALSSIQYYFVLQGIFLVGAVYFEGYVLPKTLSVLVLFTMGCGVIAYLIMGDLLETDSEECLSESNPLVNMPVFKIWLIVQWLFFWLLAPLCWVITYFGLKEKEV